jgi:hypothetical protein
MVQAWCNAHAGGDTAVMIAHRRSDVAELNTLARARLRAGGRIGDDLLASAARGFASGDRIVITRNDRALGVVNGQTGVVAGLRQGHVEIRFDDGRWVGLPEPFVRAGHLDHGYALTAHRAQGATVDRAFVLGSDELYREWGYTALSRHRIEARFYVTATRTYVNQPPAPLQPGPAVTAKVARMLAGSGAKTIAAYDADATLELRDGPGERLQQLVGEYANGRWYQRSRRADLARRIAACKHELSTTSDAIEPIVERPHEPRAGRDPLAGLGRDRGRDAGRGMGREL